MGEWMYSSTRSLTSALDGGEGSASRPGSITPRERARDTHWIGGWVGPRAVLDAVVKRKIHSPHQKSNPRTLIVQPIAQRCTDWAITALMQSVYCYTWLRLSELNWFSFFSYGQPNKKFHGIFGHNSESFVPFMHTVEGMHRDAKYISVAYTYGPYKPF
jgi:hypothetical protein